MNKTLLEIIDEETLRFGRKMVYYSKPYNCCYDEMKSYIVRVTRNLPVDTNKLLVTREEERTIISIKPKKESSKIRKSQILQIIWTPD